jgi:hypothetical protein
MFKSVFNGTICSCSYWHLPVFLVTRNLFSHSSWTGRRVNRIRTIFNFFPKEVSSVVNIIGKTFLGPWGENVN